MIALISLFDEYKFEDTNSQAYYVYTIILTNPRTKEVKRIFEEY
jgi:hypothetical protein